VQKTGPTIRISKFHNERDIVNGLTPFLVTRQIITGSGKVGAENGADDTDFQISQRADFFEKEVGLSTMVERPLINTRDEPHADSKLYRRLHVIVGDSNMSEFTIYLKVGITAIVLQLIEKGVVGKQFALQEPVAVIKSISSKKRSVLAQWLNVR
jgi:proteasome accessory factor A